MERKKLVIGVIHVPTDPDAGQYVGRLAQAAWGEEYRVQVMTFRNMLCRVIQTFGKGYNTRQVYRRLGMAIAMGPSDILVIHGLKSLQEALSLRRAYPATHLLSPIVKTTLSQSPGTITWQTFYPWIFGRSFFVGETDAACAERLRQYYAGFFEASRTP